MATRTKKGMEEVEVRGASTGRSYKVQHTPAGLLIKEKGRMWSTAPAALDYDLIYSVAVKAQVGLGSMVRKRSRRKT